MIHPLPLWGMSREASNEVIKLEEQCSIGLIYVWCGAPICMVRLVGMDDGAGYECTVRMYGADDGAGYECTVRMYGAVYECTVRIHGAGCRSKVRLQGAGVGKRYTHPTVDTMNVLVGGWLMI